MNKNELITFIRNPNSLTEADLAELEEIVANSPYFLNGRFLLAKGSKDLKHPDTKKRIASAAVYSTDRPLFKKYLSDKLFFLSQPPEEEEIEPEIVEEVKITPSESSKKSDEVTIEEPSIGESNENESIKETSERSDSKKIKPRREPRFDPTGTASFQRRWDSKAETDQSTPEPKKKSKPVSKVTFAGKKIDRSKRTKKKSIRSEILGDATPEKVVKEKPTAKKEQPVKKDDQPSSVPVEKKLESRKKEDQKSQVRERSQAKPRDQKSQSPVSESPKMETAQEKPKKETTAQARPTTTSRSEPKKTIAKRPSEMTSRKLDVPKMPSGGIDAILAELKQDMRSLKTSRVKFAEVQQKIEEEDAFSAALERATNKIPTPKPDIEDTNIESTADQPISEPEIQSVKEEIETPETQSEEKEAPFQDREGERKEKQKPEIEEPSTLESVKEESETKSAEQKQEVEKTIDKLVAKKSKSSLMPKAKKVTSSKKKTAKKEKQSKKVDTKEPTAAKKEKSSSKDEKEKAIEKSVPRKKGQDDIIDKFIAETPSIKYQKKTEQVENKDLSDLSTEWNKELASEYLAEIYLHQGNKKRAIEIYKALSLKFPDKKSYFADLISKTK